MGPDIAEASRDTSRGNVALVAFAASGRPERIGTIIDFVDGEIPIEEAIVSEKGSP